MAEDNSRFPAFPQQSDTVRLDRGAFAEIAGKVLSLAEGGHHARVLLMV